MSTLMQPILFKDFPNVHSYYLTDFCGFARDDESSFGRDDKGLTMNDKSFARDALRFTAD